jgi:hypothetical protein
MSDNAKQNSHFAPAAPSNKSPLPSPGPYGEAENYGSPGGDEPPTSTEPGSGSAGDARERHERPTTK